MPIIKYYLRDAKDGIFRNLNASVATVLLIFITLSLTGGLLLFKTSVSHLTEFLNDQVKTKIFLENDASVETIEEKLSQHESVKQIIFEPKEAIYERMTLILKNKKHLLSSFESTDFPNAFLVELKNDITINKTIHELSLIDGVKDIVYPQEMAEKIIHWSKKINHYSMSILFVFIISSFLIVSVSINLSLHQRQKDIRVKLLLGAKPVHVRFQFLFEGFLLGLFGSLLSAITIYTVFQLYFYKLQIHFHSIFSFSSVYIFSTILIMILFGSAIGFIGSFISTHKLLKK